MPSSKQRLTKASRQLAAPAELLLPCVHIVGAQHDAILATLREWSGRGVRLTGWHRAPGPSAVTPNDLVIVDLTTPRDHIEPRSVTALVDLVEVWLVVGINPVDPGWVDRARHSRVQVIQVGTGADGHVYDAIVTALVDRYRGPSWAIDAAHVLILEPGLRQLERYVAIVCAHPWLVRRPRDLADLSHTSLRTLKLDCLRLGFTRVEHFIIYVRTIAYEQLVGRGLSARAARRISGFSDPSNMRRHVRRALRRSPDVLKHDKTA